MTYWAILFRDLDNYLPELFGTRKEAKERIQRGSSVLPGSWRGAYVARVRLQVIRRRTSTPGA